MCRLEQLPPTLTRDVTCHSASAIRHALRVGVLSRPFHGVVIGRDIDLDATVLVRAAQLSAGQEFPGSHHSAASILGFGVIEDGRTHLCGAENEVDRVRPGLRVHSTHRVPATTRVGGVLVTAPDRTAVDLARTLHPRDQLVVLDAALRSGLVTAESLRTEIALHAGLRGVTSVRELVDHADARAESPQESRLRWIALAAGLPPLDLQIEVPTATACYRIDMGYERLRLGIEYDGALHADRLEWDRARHNALDRLGWRMLYLTRDDVRCQQRTADRLASAVGIPTRPILPWHPPAS